MNSDHPYITISDAIKQSFMVNLPTNANWANALSLAKDMEYVTIKIASGGVNATFSDCTSPIARKITFNIEDDGCLYINFIDSGIYSGIDDCIVLGDFKPFDEKYIHAYVNEENEEEGIEIVMPCIHNGYVRFRFFD